jgi:hypothetical protein
MFAASRQGQIAPQLPASCFFMHSHVLDCSNIRRPAVPAACTIMACLAE